MAEKTIVVDIDIKAEDIKAAQAAMSEAAKSSALLTVELNKLKEEQSANNKAAKDGAISATELAERQAELKLKMTETSKALSESNKEYANNKTVVDAATGSNEQLRARLSLLTKEYNGLSKEQRENSASGKQMQATIKTLSDKLKENEKAVGDNRRNVGNYEEAIRKALGSVNIMGVNVGDLVDQLNNQSDASEDASKSSGLFSGGLKGVVSGLNSATIASLKFLATPIGAAIAAVALAIALAVGQFKVMAASLNRTEDGAAALSGVMNVFKGIMGGVLQVIQPIALFLVEGLADGFEMLGKMVESSSKQIEKGLRFLGLDNAANGLAKVTTTIKETSIATAQLAKAEAELNKIQREQGKIQLAYQNRAEKLRQIRDDESKSMKERIQANKDLGAVLTEQSNSEMKLAKRSLEIANLRIKADGANTENLDKKAEAELKIAEIEERITSQRSEQMTNENSLIREGVAIAKEAASQRIKLAKDKAKAEKEASEAIIKAYQDERSLIDLMAETKKNQAISNIANAEEQAETIRYIERQALLDKIANIDEETIAATAGAEAIGAVDEAKYQNQLAERAKYQAQITMMDRAALAKSFTDKIAAISIDEKLELDAAELSIDNEKKLSEEKAKISIKYLETKLALMTSVAGADGIITDEELKNLKLVQNEIAKIKGLLVKNEEGSGTLGDMLGLSEKEVGKIQSSINDVTQILQGVQGLVSAGAEQRIQEIEQQNQYEVAAVENSTLSEEAKAEKIKAINRKAADEKYKIEVEQFKVGKALSIALAIANTATAVVAQLSNPTPYAGFVLAALAAATGVVQIATIAAQKPPPPPKFARGGILRGRTHAQGGIQLYGRDGTHYGEAEDGEPVLTSGVSRDPYLLKQASDINVAAGGRPLVNSNYMAGGGIASPTFAARQATSSNTQVLEARIDQLGDRIELMQPIVRVSDINRINRQSVKVQQSADL